ncbi:MAG: glycosyltransferase [Phormidesmis sp.]
MQILATPRLPAALRLADILPLTVTRPLPVCRLCVVVPIRNEAEHLPTVVKALAQQVDEQGHPVNPHSYEVLILANNCSDDSAAIAHSLQKEYSALQLHIVEVTLPKAEAHIGTARRMAMNEAYRRLCSIGQGSLQSSIIASTDGDTEVSATWVSALLKEFDKGVDAVGGRILTRRQTEADINTPTSLYFLRYMAHGYLSAQLEALLDPQPHDCLPRHAQYHGANLAITAEMYGRIGGIPSIPSEEDVALYHRLQQADAKVRHSPHVRVMTSARQRGRASGGLADRLSQLAEVSQQRQAFLVEMSWLTESRILVRRRLRETWKQLNGEVENSFVVRKYAQSNSLLAKSLGLSTARLREHIEVAPTFGYLIAAIEAEQKQRFEANLLTHLTTDVSVANMQIRQRLQSLRQQPIETAEALTGLHLHRLLQALEQVQAIPLFSLTG